MEIPLIGISIWTITKVFFLVAIAIYVVFAFVMVKQVNLMTDTLEVDFETSIRIISYLHLIFSVVVFVVALILL